VESKPLKVGFVGAGRAGTALALALRDKGYAVTAVSSRTPASSWALAERVEGCTARGTAQQVADDCDLIFITTPDDTIETVAMDVRWKRGTGVAHCSGAKSAAALEAAMEQGALIGSFHPMQTFPGTDQGGAELSGVAFAVEGPPPLMDTLKEMARGLGGWPVEIRPQDRALYHLSGFLACGSVVALIAQAAELWRAMGYSREQGLEVLLPILRTTVDNLGNQAIPASLTGPISRGDIGTVQRHLDALEDQAPSVLPLYCQIALGGATLAREKGGIDEAKEKELVDLLEERLSRARRQFVG
jgi:predicted short-subunit dehydrogenase-like oxidoreductase (DUF2520 family)